MPVPDLGQGERVLIMRLRDHPLLVMSMVLGSVLAGFTLAILTFGRTEPLPWGYVITGVIVATAMVSIAVAIVDRRERRRP